MRAGWVGVGRENSKVKSIKANYFFFNLCLCSPCVSLLVDASRFFPLLLGLSSVAALVCLSAKREKSAGRHPRECMAVSQKMR